MVGVTERARIEQISLLLSGGLAIALLFIVKTPFDFKLFNNIYPIEFMHWLLICLFIFFIAHYIIKEFQYMGIKFNPQGLEVAYAEDKWLEYINNPDNFMYLNDENTTDSTVSVEFHTFEKKDSASMYFMYHFNEQITNSPKSNNMYLVSVDPYVGRPPKIKQFWNVERLPRADKYYYKDLVKQFDRDLSPGGMKLFDYLDAMDEDERKDILPFVMKGLTSGTTKGG